MATEAHVEHLMGEARGDLVQDNERNTPVEGHPLEPFIRWGLFLREAYGIFSCVPCVLWAPSMDDCLRRGHIGA